ncbi:MAG: efflux RND transporter periplasmic adaptor subunit [Sedimenticola sp.]|nr:efflux RND transporter periplasmic adaptor subunit [Sedimenticola sp.]
MAVKRKWVILIPVVLGIAALMLLKKSSIPPLQEPVQEQARLVRIIEAPKLTVIPRAEGHGTVQPARTWEAVAQVKGKVIHKHPRLQKGAILESGELILQIDPADYQLAIAQAQADIEATRAQLQELEAKTANTRASLQIEQDALTLNRRELERKRQLVGKGGISRSDVESQERSVLAQQQSVQAQVNTLNLFPSQKALLEAQLARLDAALAAARRNLENTRIHLPFSGRIAAVNVEQEQYVREGEVLATADDLQQAEIEIQVPIDQMSSLVSGRGPVDIVGLDPDTALQKIGLSAHVTLQENGLLAEWPARFARMSDTLDPETRTVGVIVEVDQPYAGVQPGTRPPLVKGLFVKVTLAGQPLPERIVVPRIALDQNRIYVVNAEQRLEVREVSVALRQPEFVVIDKGLEAGERVVISDLLPAIEGMLLQPEQDPVALQRLLEQSAGGDAR